MSTDQRDGLELTFRDLEFGLVDLMRQREECAAEYDRVRHDPEVQAGLEDIALAALDQCDLAIAAYLKACVAKVDGVAAFILKSEAAAETIEDEQERLEVLRIQHQDRADRVREMALRVIQEVNLELAAKGKPEHRTIEGERHTLKLRRNPPAVVIAQPNLVPDNVQKFTLSMTYDEIRVLLDTSESTHKLAWKAKREPSKSAIAAALKARETCPECKGFGRSPLSDDSCQRCDGEGTIPGSVPGCRLESAERLEIL